MSDLATLLDLGLSSPRADEVLAAAGGAEIGRVTSEHRIAWDLATRAGRVRATFPGKLRRLAEEGQGDLPAPGDFVAFDRESGGAVIRAVLPRHSVLRRKAAGRADTLQVVAVNVDEVLVCTGLDGDLNARRLERYLALVLDGGASPSIVLTKADLCDDREAALAEVRAVAPAFPVYVVSTHTGEGLPALDALLVKGRTLGLVGSSGVGKSTLLNRWQGRDVQATAGVRDDGRGRHTTTRRDLFPVGDAWVLDTPGMREVGLRVDEASVKDAFTDVEEIAAGCRFSDCAHRTEPGCAVRAAVDAGELPAERLAALHKLRDEVAATDPARAAERKAEEKRLSRLIKDVKSKRK